MVLYHVISCYQLLCVILHSLLYQNNEHTELLLPDFFEESFPDIKKIKGLFFDDVYLMPYKEIPHDIESITRNTLSAYKSVVTFEPEEYKKIYVAGAQFYFTDILINRKIHFECFEEASGMYSRPNVLRKNVGLKYKVQQEWARKNGLFDLSNPLIDKVYCNFSAQKFLFKRKKAVDHDAVKILETIDDKSRQKIVDFFVPHKYDCSEKSVIVLTEQFSNLGKMTAKQQRQLYRKMSENIPPDYRVIVKPHPNDKEDYSRVFKNPIIIEDVFPSELLPFVFEHRPEYITTVSSTGAGSLSRYFKIMKTVSKTTMKGIL